MVGVVTPGPAPRPRRLVVGITGASGVVYGVRALERLAEAGVETHLLLTRAADVVLKERRRLVLLVREAPLHLGHLRNMVAVTEMGAIVSPPVPAFYAKPRTVDDIVDHTVGRALDLFGIEVPGVTRWREGDEP